MSFNRTKGMIDQTFSDGTSGASKRLLDRLKGLNVRQIVRTSFTCRHDLEFTFFLKFNNSLNKLWTYVTHPTAQNRT